MAERVARRAEYVSPEERGRRLQRMTDLAAQVRQEAADLRASEAAAAAADESVEPPQLRH